MKSTMKARAALVLSIAVLVTAGIAGSSAANDSAGPHPIIPTVIPIGPAPDDPGTSVPGNPGLPGGGLCVKPDPGAPEPADGACNPGLPVGNNPQVVVPTPGMAGVHPRPYDSATVGDDDRTVQVDFVSGIEPCSVLDHVDVRYGDHAVTITLFEGYDASAGNVACIEIGVFKRVIVTLDQPLAGRDIVDGAAT